MIWGLADIADRVSEWQDELHREMVAASGTPRFGELERVASKLDGIAELFNGKTTWHGTIDTLASRKQLIPADESESTTIRLFTIRDVWTLVANALGDIASANSVVRQIDDAPWIGHTASRAHQAPLHHPMGAANLNPHHHATAPAHPSAGAVPHPHHGENVPRMTTPEQLLHTAADLTATGDISVTRDPLEHAWNHLNPDTPIDADTYNRAAQAITATAGIEHTDTWFTVMARRNLYENAALLRAAVARVPLPQIEPDSGDTIVLDADTETTP